MKKVGSVQFVSAEAIYIDEKGTRVRARTGKSEACGYKCTSDVKVAIDSNKRSE